MVVHVKKLNVNLKQILQFYTSVFKIADFNFWNNLEKA